MSFTLSDEEFYFFSRMVQEKSVRKNKKSSFTTFHRIEKIAPAKQHAFGWASVAYLPDGSLYTDWQGDFIDRIPDLEESAYDFALHSRDAGTDHIGKGSKGTLIESFVSTPEKWEAMGIPEGVLPVGWWAGFHVNDPATWNAIQKGHYRMFSVQGKGRREPLT